MMLIRGEYDHKVSGYCISIGIIRKHYPNLEEWVLVGYDNHLSFCPISTLELYDKKVVQRAVKPHIKKYRMTLPVNQSKTAGIKNGDQVSIIVGTEEYVEIWNSKRWNKHWETLPSLLELLECQV